MPHILNNTFFENHIFKLKALILSHRAKHDVDPYRNFWKYFSQSFFSLTDEAANPSELSSACFKAGFTEQWKHGNREYTVK